MFNVAEVKNAFGIRTVTVWQENADGTFDTLAIRRNKAGMVKIDYPTTQEYDTVKLSFSVICGKDKQRRKIAYQMIPRVQLADAPASHEIKVTSDYIRHTDAIDEICRMSADTASDILELLGDSKPVRVSDEMAKLLGFPVALHQDTENLPTPQHPQDKSAHVYTEPDGHILLHCVWMNGSHYGDFEDASKAQAVADSLNGVRQNIAKATEVAPEASQERTTRVYSLPIPIAPTSLVEAISPPTGLKTFRQSKRSEYQQAEMPEPISIY